MILPPRPPRPSSASGLMPWRRQRWRLLRVQRDDGGRAPRWTVSLIGGIGLACGGHRVLAVAWLRAVAEAWRQTYGRDDVA